MWRLLNVFRSSDASPAARRKVSLLQLIAATYFMVCGGPYGLEDMLPNTGYIPGLVVLVLIPLIWSLPTTLMVGELSSSIPSDGGYYVWVRRALGPFWGFQEAWLSLSASIFDMAIYPTLMVSYLAHLLKLLGAEAPQDPLLIWALEMAVIAACVIINIRGARTVGGSSVLFGLILLAPFAAFVFAAFANPARALAHASTDGFDLFAGIIVAMFNYMGWDNTSTIAGEVDHPQRTYPRAMFGALGLIMLTYIVPVTAAMCSGLPSGDWETGSWVTICSATAGRYIGILVAIAGMAAMLGTFNSLILSYSRVPMVLAEDGYLPKVFAKRHSKTGAPWVSLLACATAWAFALQLNLPRLFALDIILYGMSLLLEFAALVSLRRREPALPRPFRVPGGMTVALLLGVGPAILIGLAAYHERSQTIDAFGFGQVNALLFGLILAVLGPIVYFAVPKVMSRWKQGN